MSKEHKGAEVVFSEKGKQIIDLFAQTKQNDEKVIFLGKELDRLYGILPALRTEAKIKQVETKIEELETQVENLKKENKQKEIELEGLAHKSIMETELLLRGKWKKENN